MESVRLLKTFKVNTDEDLDAHTDLVAEELFKLEEGDDSLSDSDVSAAIGDGVVEIGVVAVAPTFDDAVATADAAIRTAIHAAGGSTPDWTTPVFSPTSSTAELLPA